MSSTSRGGQRSEADNYATPAWAVQRLLEAADLPGGNWLEPAAGDGAIIKAAMSLQGQRPGYPVWHAVELRQECERDLAALLPVQQYSVGDYLDPATVPSAWPATFDVIITNPPFRLAEQFLHRALQHGRFVVLLLRLNFLGSEKRAAWLREHMPDVYVLPNRPTFFSPDAKSGQGRWQTDSCEYAWLVWHSQPRTTGKVVLLASTDKDARHTK